MKKLILTLVFASVVASVSAQNEKTNESLNEPFNKWSIELAGGFNAAQRPVSSGFTTAFPAPYVVDLGVRYMFNNKFGLKADFGLNSFTNKKNTPAFDSKYYRIDLQGVANLGRIMNFETWTNSFGLLAHTGVGVARLEGDNPSIKNNIANFIVGVTPQIKLSDRFVLTGDVSTMLNARQAYAFDGQSTESVRGFSGILFNATVGLTYYLGKNQKHADWTVLKDESVLSLEKRVDALETMNNDTDRDGVVDYLDTEPNTMSGVMVDSKGRAIDLNNNGVPDEIEKYIDSKYKTGNSATPSNSETIKNLVNGGYVSVFFDFNKTTPNSESTDAISYVLTYLRNNPSATVDIVGHADEVGGTAYNNKLSAARANNVKETLLKSNIAASRLNVIAAGEDTSVNKSSSEARKLVRRVTFQIK